MGSRRSLKEDEPPVPTGIGVDICLEKGLQGAREEVEATLLRIKLGGAVREVKGDNSMTAGLPVSLEG